MTNQAKSLCLTYLNIRQSISVLLLKLIFIDFLAAALLLISDFSHLLVQEILGINLTNPYIFLTTIAILGSVKIPTAIYVVLHWLNEYYEITPDEIVHKSGIIFKKTEKYRFDNVRSMVLSKGFIGELLNFGTITLYDIRMLKYIDMFLIHNPKRYYKIIKALNPSIEYKIEESIVSPLSPMERGEKE